ncbi:unnamed protein product [Amoebophrya sp. A25]|nr:unnamed protein product [Amoebophrya sp. A25]|eukprot:GSA25T00025846001.1
MTLVLNMKKILHPSRSFDGCVAIRWKNGAALSNSRRQACFTVVQRSFASDARGENEAPVAGKRYTGFVRRNVYQKGHGFINTDDPVPSKRGWGDSVFYVFDHIADGKIPERGDRVTFELSPSEFQKGEYMAIAIEGGTRDWKWTPRKASKWADEPERNVQRRVQSDRRKKAQESWSRWKEGACHEYFDEKAGWTEHGAEQARPEAAKLAEERRKQKLAEELREKSKLDAERTRAAFEI